MSLLGLECVRCRRQFAPPVTVGLCECGGPRLPRYDAAFLRRLDLKARIAQRPPSLLSRWHELLPFDGPRYLDAVSMGETQTPLVHAGPLGAAVGLAGLRLKLDLVLPSQSLKDRPHSAIVAAALERGAQVVSVNSSGNAATALAAHANRVGMKVVVAVPAGSSPAKINKARALGAHVLQVAGSVDHCAAVLRVLARRAGWFGAESWVNPFMLEGTKTIGLEIAVQSGWRAPDTVVLPLGNGAATLGPWKAFQELHEIGVIDRVPRIVGVQFEGCAPIARAFEAGAATVTPAVARPTLTTTLMISNPAVSGPMILQVLRDTGGRAISVGDDEVREAMRLLASHAGCLAEPAGAISLAGTIQLARAGWLRPDEDVVCLVSGSASNQPESMELVTPPPFQLAPGQESTIDPASLLARV
jgi:threonine synthase